MVPLKVFGNNIHRKSVGESCGAKCGPVLLQHSTGPCRRSLATFVSFSMAVNEHPVMSHTRHIVSVPFFTLTFRSLTQGKVNR